MSAKRESRGKDALDIPPRVQALRGVVGKGRPVAEQDYKDYIEREDGVPSVKRTTK